MPCNHRTLSASGLILVVMMLFLTSCNFGRLDVGPVKVDKTEVALDQAESVNIAVNLGTGDLAIGSGADKLMEAVFTYNVPDWKPEVNYGVDNGLGQLTIRQPEQKTGIPINLDRASYSWDLSLNEGIPIDMYVTMGAGDGDLELEDLSLERLSFTGGLGDVTIALGGSSVQLVDIRLGAGDIFLDLEGIWRQNVTGHLKGGIGRATVNLPSQVGVKVVTRNSLGTIQAPGFQRSGFTYINDAFNEADITITLDIEGGIGDIILKQSP